MPAKPRPPSRIGRKRRTLGWTLLTFGLLVAGVWVASGWWTLKCYSKFQTFYIQRGVLLIYHDPDLFSWTIEALNPADRGWEFWGGKYPAQDVSLGLYFTYDMPGTYRWRWLLFWPIPLFLWTPAALLLRSGILARRRAMTNACPKCGYSLAGLSADAPCPECGKVLTKA